MELTANIGIYCLYFDEIYGKFYIGLSQDLHGRKQGHYSKLKNNNHPNYLLQEAYNKYGFPEFNIIENCSVKDLPIREKYWIKEFEAYSSGFNLTPGGEGTAGENHFLAIYSKDKYVQVFMLIVDTTLSLIDISINEDISYNIVRDIAAGRAHTYLKELYPEKYNLMLQKIGRSSSLYTKDVYITIMNTIAYTNKSLREVSDYLSVSYQIVRNIAYGSSHKYLYEEFPDTYKLMQSKKRDNIGGKWKVLQ